MDEGDLYRHDNLEADNVIHQEDAKKSETDYDA